jgi:hypothetical protein
MQFTILEPRILHWGHGSGAFYLGGLCEWKGELVEAYAIPAGRIGNRAELERLLHSPIAVTSDRFEYTVGAGLLIWQCELPFPTDTTA